MDQALYFISPFMPRVRPRRSFRLPTIVSCYVLTQNWEHIKRARGIFVPRNVSRLFAFFYMRRRPQGACHEQLRFSEIQIDYRKQSCFTSLRSLPRQIRISCSSLLAHAFLFCEPRGCLPETTVRKYASENFAKVGELTK